MSVSAADVMKLRSRTNAPMMDCKAALQEANGDMDKATELIRKKNASIQEKKAEREAAEGRIAVCLEPTKLVAAIVELRCESAPVAKTDSFVQLANDVARHVALTATEASTPDALMSQAYLADPKRTVKDRIGDVVGMIRENMKPARFARLGGGQFGSYIHHDGSVGVLVQVEGSGQAEPQLLKDICMHITARQPRVARREDVDPAVLAREKEIATAQAAATGKPAKIAEKIAEGKLKTWYADNVLLEQPFVKDESKTVGDLLKAAGLTLKRFVRFKVGEVPT